MPTKISSHLLFLAPVRMNMIQRALILALQAALVLSLSHGLCVAIVMYHDLTGKWSKYALNKNRTSSWIDYATGMKSFCADLTLLFIPFMTFSIWYRYKEITECTDSMAVCVVKLIAGYVLGKLWAFAVHYALHHPLLYRFHRRHHKNPKTIVAASAWEDSLVEYAIMELPSFGMTILFLPTHFWTHLIHLCLHGWDGACGHSGFKAPGIFGSLFDGEYHYYHHLCLNINYAELEILDKMFGTHHTQRERMPAAFR